LIDHERLASRSILVRLGKCDISRN
jgi:hypothetical protein